jgi:hypothetical protein
MSTPDYLTVKDLENYQWRVENRESPRPLALSGKRLTIPAAVELACLVETNHDHGMGRHLQDGLSDCTTWRLFRRLGWPSCGHSQRVQDDNVGFIAMPSDASDLFWSRCLRAFEQGLTSNGFPIGLSRALTGALGEMADNVWQHSQADTPGLVGYEVRARQLTFAVADVGIGVLDSLRTNSEHRHLTSSMEALETAILPGVSRHDGGGYGFSSLFQAVAELWGITRLRSGEAALIFNRQTEQRTRQRYYLPALPGLQVLVSCRLKAPLQI